MYLVVIAWIYVVLMMSVAEATNTTGTLLGAIITFVLYGLLPVSLVVYLMSAPARNKAIKKRNSEELAKSALDADQMQSANIGVAANNPEPAGSDQPDAGGQAAGGSGNRPGT